MANRRLSMRKIKRVFPTLTVSKWNFFDFSVINKVLLLSPDFDT